MLRGLMKLAAIGAAGYAWRKFRNRGKSQNTYDSSRIGSTNRTSFPSARGRPATIPDASAGDLGYGTATGAPVGASAGVSGGSSYGSAGSTSSYSTGAGAGAGTGSLAGSGTSGLTGGGSVGSSSIRSDTPASADDMPRR